MLWAKIQYVGIASVGPLWLLFSASYAGAVVHAQAPPGRAVDDPPPDRADGGDQRMAPGGLAVGIARRRRDRDLRARLVVLDSGEFNYVAVLTGTVLVARALRRSPPPFRAQFHVLMAAALLPLTGNLVYVTGNSIPGLDPTPLAFVSSSLLFTWALFRHHLFELVPVARDMVVDSLSDAVIVLDTSRRVLDMNAAAKELAPVVRDWPGQPVEQVLPFLQPHAVELGAQTSSTLTVSDEERSVHYDVRLMPVPHARAS